MKKELIDRENGGGLERSKEFLMKKDLSIARKVALRTPRDTLNIVPIRPIMSIYYCKCTYYSHCSPLRKAKPTGILHFAKGKTDCGRPNKNIPFS